MAQLVFGAVFRASDGAQLAQYAAAAGNFSEVARECLDRVRASGGAEARFTVTADGYAFHFAQHGGYTVCVAAPEALGQQLPFAAARRVADMWAERHWEAGQAAPPGGMQSAFGCAGGSGRPRGWGAGAPAVGGRQAERKLVVERCASPPAALPCDRPNKCPARNETENEPETRNPKTKTTTRRRETTNRQPPNPNKDPLCRASSSASSPKQHLLPIQLHKTRNMPSQKQN
jgi:hypothetical protein